MATRIKSSVLNSSFFFSSFLLLLLTITSHAFVYKEATIDGIQSAFKAGQLTSLQLVRHYIEEINKRNSTLQAVIELNPEAESLAQQADTNRPVGSEGITKLAGIPILLKDIMGTKDRLNTTAGSYALLGSVVRQDAFVVKKLRDAGAIILGKASLSQWSGFRNLTMSPGWSSRVGQGKNPYTLDDEVCGSSSGSAISTAANLVTVALGTETDGSIICPSAYNSVVGIKPTVNLTSRAGVIPLSLRQDTVGPIGRTVTDAVRVLDIIVGRDDNDPGTIEAATHIPAGGYAQYLKSSGLSGKRLGILRNIINFTTPDSIYQNRTYEALFKTLRDKGSTLIDNLVINWGDLDKIGASELVVLKAEFKRDLNAYLGQLQSSPVKNLSDIITFNNNNPILEKMAEYGQPLLLDANLTNGINITVQNALSELQRLTQNGFEKLMNDNNLDALLVKASPQSPLSFIAVGGFPAITVPAGYDSDNYPIDLTFAGLKYQEPKLIEIAYAFEQATNKRQPPPDRLQMVREREGVEFIAES